MTLQDKMYKYLRQYIGTIANFKVVAKYVAEIAEKEYVDWCDGCTTDNTNLKATIEKMEKYYCSDRPNCKMAGYWSWICNDLQDEVDELKEQLQTAVDWHGGEVDLNDKLLKEVTNLSKASFSSFGILE